MRRLQSRLASLFRNLFRGSQVERDLDDELNAAVETLADRYAAEGMPRDRARRAACLELGGVEQLKEEIRDGRVGATVDAASIDARYALRTLAKSPGFTAAVVITMALGIGANSAIFSVVHALLLAPLPYRAADRLIFVWSDMTDSGYPRAPLSGPELGDLRSRTTTCSAFGAIWSNTTALTGEGQPEQLRIGLVTDDFFDVLGAPPALGRTFQAQDAVPGARPSILLSWPLFERRYGADRTLIGRQILVNDRPTTVIGVMPREFRLLLPPDSSVPDDLQAWQPFGAGLTRAPRGQQYLRVIGRMRPGVTFDAARTDINAIAGRISREFSEYGSAGRLFITVPLQQDAVREMRPALIALFAGVAILLVIACVNVASLLIARAVARAKETAMRLALGASRGRLVRQCTIEGLLIASLGLVAGIPAGIVVLRLLQALRPASLSRIELSRFDPPVLLFTAAVALAWGFLLSLAPLTEIFKAELTSSLQRQARPGSSAVRYRARAVLVVLQIALGVVLLVSAALLVRAFTRVQQVNPGFTTAGALTFRVAVPFQRYRPPAAFNAFSRDLEQRLAAIPGVTGVGAISHLPYDDQPNWGGGYLPEAVADPSTAPTADYRTITPGLFAAIGVRPIEGRGFTETDQDGKNPVVIIDDRLAQRLWPGRSAVGQRIVVDPGSQGVPTQKATIVGVVPHLRLRSLIADMTEQVFFPERLVLRNPMAYVVRSDRDPATVVADVRQAMAALDARLPIYDVRPLDTYVEAAKAARRFTMQLAAAFAAIALALACVGVYGVLAYAVERRRQEFGVRLALGASPGRVVAGVMREGLRLALAGCAAGLVLAFAAARLLSAQLYGIRPNDPVSYAATLSVLAAAAAFACWIPARRATAVSPMEALRAE